MKSVFTVLLACLTTFSFAQKTANLDFREVFTSMDNGKYKKALDKLEELPVERYLTAQYYTTKSDCHWALKEYKSSYETLSRGIQKLPDSLYLYDARGNVLIALQYYREAVMDFTEAFKRCQDDVLKAHYLSNRGGAKTHLRDFQGAYDDLKLAQEFDPTNLNILNNLAMICDEIGKPEQTIVYLEKILEIDSAYVAAYVNLGFKFQMMEKYEQSIAYFDKAVELQPEEALSYSNRSYSKLKMGDLSGAMKDINTSIKLFPSNAYAYRNRALIYLEKGKTSKACEDLNTAEEYKFSLQYGDEVKELMKKHCEE